MSSVNGLVASRRFLTLSSCSVGPMSGTGRLGSVILPDSLGADGIGLLRLASWNIFRIAKSCEPKLSESWSWFSMVWMIFWGVDDVGLHVLGCRVDILGTNCTKLLKIKMSGGGGGGGGERESRFGFSTCNHVRGAARRLLLDKKYILSLVVHFTADKKRRPPAHSCKWACNEGSIHKKLLIHSAFVQGRNLKKADYGLDILLPSHAAGERRSRSPFQFQHA